MANNELRQRYCRVTVGTLALQGADGAGLDVKFKIRKSLVNLSTGKVEPNTCDLEIYNLSEAHRKALEQSNVISTSVASQPGTGGQVVPVRIDAGYQGLTAQVWLGELRAAETIFSGPDRITTLTTGDGDKAVSRQRINVAMGPGTTSATAMRNLLQALGIGQGNLPRALELLNQSGKAQMYARGAVLKGLAADHMTDLCRSAGLDWSIQEGQLQVTTLGQPLDGQAIRVAADSGMIESPTVDTKGVLSVTTLMIPGIRPGVKIAVESRSLKGGFRVISCEYEGQTFGQNSPWYTHCEAKRY